MNRNLLFKNVLFVASMFSVATASAATVELISSNSSGESWETGSDWSNGQGASAGNDYVVNSGTLRSPNSNSSETFGGDSLTLNGGTFALKATSSNRLRTVNNFTLAGGTISNFGGNFTIRVGGDLTLQDATVSKFAASSSNADRNIQIESVVSGTGDAEIRGNTGNSNRVIFTNASNDFTGTWSVLDGAILDFNYDHNSGADLVLETGSTLRFDQNLTFSSLTIGGNSIAAGSYTLSEFTSLNASYANFFSNDNGSTFTVLPAAVPEPHHYALGLGIAATLFCAWRRRRA